MLTNLSLASNSDDMHPVSLKNFLSKPHSWQKKYLETFPESSHARHFKERPTHKQPPKSNLPAPIHKDTPLAAINEIRSLNRETSGVINHHSIQAVERLTDKDLRLAADRIDSNRHDIIAAVENQAEAYPVLYKTGLGGLEKMMHRAPANAIRDGEVYEGEFEEIHDAPITKTERRSAERVLMQTATFALLATGIILMGAGAAPIAAVIGRVMLETWGTKGSKFDQHKQEKQRRKKDKEMREERELLAMQEQQKEEKRQARIAARQNQELAVAAKQDFVEEHADTLSNVMDQMIDVLTYYSIDDLKERVHDLVPQVATASSSLKAFGNFITQAGFKYEHNAPYYDVFNDKGKDFLFHVDRTFGGTETSVLDDVVAYHFGCDDFFATACILEDRIRIRVDED